MKKNIFTLILFVNTIFVYSQNQDTIKNEYERTSDFYNKLITNSTPQVSLLNLFFTNMPKGGDLHHHYSGTIYAETYLKWVKRKKWKIDKCSLKIVKDNSSDGCALISVDDLMKNDELYRRLLTLWSDKDYYNHFNNQPPPDQNFFNTFGYFRAVSNEYMDEGLKIV